MFDHVHMLISIPPKYYSGHRLWARGYFVDSVGRDTETIKRYIQQQETEDKRLDQIERNLHQTTSE